VSNPLKRDSAGKLSRGSGGDLSRCPDCDECQYCSDDSDDCTGNEPECPTATCCTPNQYSVVLTNILLCPCSQCSTTSTHYGLISNTVSTSFTVRQVTDEECQWENLNIGTITAGTYSDACSTLVSSQTGTISALLTKINSTNFTLVIKSIASVSPGLIVFEDTITKTAHICDETLLFTHSGPTYGTFCGCDQIAVNYINFSNTSATASLAPCS
jgi:hypothetical protein